MRPLLAPAAVLALWGIALAAPVTYVFPTPGVVWGSTAARAREAAAKVPKVQAAEADMTAHTVTARFDDAEVSADQIVKALNEAGYTVGTPERR